MREDIEDLIVFVVEAMAVYFKFCFDVRLLSIEVNLAFFFTYKPIKVIEPRLVFRDRGISRQNRGLSLLSFKVLDSALFL